MSATGISVLDRQINVAMRWIIDVDEEFGWEDRLKSYQALAVVLRALRERLTVDESADFSAQLPILLRGAYYESYQPARMPVQGRDVQQFLERIRAEFQQTPVVDAEMIARRVFRVLSRRVSAGEIEDVRGMLPDSFQYLWTSQAMPGQISPSRQATSKLNGRARPN